MEVGGRILRKRRRPSCDKDGPNGASAASAASDGGLSALLEAAKSWRRVVVVSGSGLSASSGMSTFSTPGGLYERAASAARLAKGGKQLFCWSFFERRRHDALAFLADVHAEAAAARPTPGHKALARLARAGALSRHFTLNIDGLSERAGMRTWRLEEDPEFNGEKERENKEEEGEKEKAEEGADDDADAEEERPRRQRSSSSSRSSRSRSRSASLPPLDPKRGVTVELHGNVHELVCPDCHRVTPMTETALAALRARVDLPCVGCPGGVVSSEDDEEDEDDKKKKGAPVPSSSSLAPPPFSEQATGGPLRLRVMLYDDAQGDAITPDEVLDLLEADVAAADAVLWVGLSFEQSATTSYFRRVRAALQAVGRCPGQAEEGIGARDGRGARGRGRRGGRGGRGRGRERGGSRGGGSGGSAGEEDEEGCCSDSPSNSPSASPSRSLSPAKQQGQRRPRRPLPCLQAIVNPAADDAAFNLLSSCHNRDGIDVLEVRCSSDVALEELAKVLCRGREGVGGEEEEAGEGAAAEKAEVVKKEGAATAGTATAATTTADVAADASTGFAATVAPAPPPRPSSSSQLELEVARARAAIAAARAKAAAVPSAAVPSAAAAAAAAAEADLTAAAAAATRAAGGESPPASPRLPAVVVVPPVAAAFASAPPLSGEEGAAKDTEEEKEAAAAAAAEPPKSASPAVADDTVGAAEARPAGRIRLTCTSEPGDDDSDDEDGDVDDDGGGVVKGAFCGGGGEH